MNAAIMDTFLAAMAYHGSANDWKPWGREFEHIPSSKVVQPMLPAKNPLP